jgi:hypothetical protein
MRANLLPLSRSWGFWQWDDKTRSNVWSRGLSLLDNLAGVLQRRLIDALKGRGDGLPLSSRFGASFSDLLSLWNGQVEELRFADLIYGLALFWSSNSGDNQFDSTPDLSPTGVWFDANDEPHINYELPSGLSAEELRDAHALPRAYALLKLLFVGGRLPARPIEQRAAQRSGEEPYPPSASDVLSLVLAGRVHEAAHRASRKLKALGYPPVVAEAAMLSQEFALSPTEARRLAGMLLIPVRNPGVLAALVIKPQST